jgi:hypothetical protein
MGAHSKPAVSYPTGLDAAILKALPSFRDRKRSAANLVAGLKVHRELRSFVGVTEDQIEAALGTMFDQGHFAPDQYITPERTGGGARRVSKVAVAAGAH